MSFNISMLKPLFIVAKILQIIKYHPLCFRILAINLIRGIMKKMFCSAVVGSLFLASTLSYANELSVTIMGSGSPIYNEDRASAGVLLSKGDTQILVDMGSGVRANLYKAGIDNRNLDALMFTHHHIDHNAEFNSMLIGSVMGRGKVSVYGPTGTVKFTETYLDLYAEDLAYRLGKRNRTLEERKNMVVAKDLKSGDTFSIDGIKVTTLEVPHTIETLAYRFDYKDQSIVITGDLTYTDKLPSFAQGADCMIIDSGGMIQARNTSKRKKQNNNSNKRNGQAHLNLDDSSSLAALAKVETLVYTHFAPGNIDKQSSLEVIRQRYSGKVIFSEDLMKLNCTNSQ